MKNIVWIVGFAFFARILLYLAKERTMKGKYPTASRICLVAGIVSIVMIVIGITQLFTGPLEWH